ncbi:MAG: rane protein [Acidimicrobiales bacterium]|nr:rane protein [Acidimicrobiales bacterium]
MTAPRAATIARDERTAAATMLNKVPALTIYFWFIKVMGTTVGETAADYLNDTRGLGLNNTSIVVGVALAIALAFQFRARRYVPALYWSVVVLISIAGTLMTDNLVDGHGVSLNVTTAGFTIALALTFVGWYMSERSLSIHTIVTTKREAWYWLTILFTFALGTSAGDLISEKLNLGYWKSGLMFAALIGLVAAARFAFKMGEILAFWMAYILTRPLGASLGDYLLQKPKDGGLGLGTGFTTFSFLAIIVTLVLYLSISRTDLMVAEEEPT